MAKHKGSRGKRGKTGKSKGKKKTRKLARRKAASKTRKKKSNKSSKPRKRTTAEGMKRAMKLKQAAETREHQQHPEPQTNWPTQIPQSVEPDPIPNNLREQGDIANIIQNTTNRRAG